MFGRRAEEHTGAFRDGFSAHQRACGLDQCRIPRSGEKRSAAKTGGGCAAKVCCASNAIRPIRHANGRNLEPGYGLGVPEVISYSTFVSRRSAMQLKTA